MQYHETCCSANEYALTFRDDTSIHLLVNTDSKNMFEMAGLVKCIHVFGNMSKDYVVNGETPLLIIFLLLKYSLERIA